MRDIPKQFDESRPVVTRRRFIGSTIGTLLLPMLPVQLLAGESSKSAFNPFGEINGDTLYALSQKLVGGGDINRKAVGLLATLIESNPDLKSGFAELAALNDPTSEEAQNRLSDDARSTCRNILFYWFDGYFGGKPVRERSTIFFALPVWGTVDYLTQPTLCKGYGYWARAIGTSANTAEA